MITPADIETVTQQIVRVWEKIQNREFYIGCGKEDCHWCNFVKTNEMAVALHEIEEEESEPWFGEIRKMKKMYVLENPVNPLHHQNQRSYN